MVYTSDSFIKQIKDARDSQEVRVLIQKCMAEFRLKSDNVRIDRKYTRNILLSLNYYKTKESKPEALANINAAIEMVKKIHEDGTENIL